MTYVEDIARDGFVVLENVIDSETVATLLETVTGKAFGIRNLLNVLPSTRDLANHRACRSLVEPLLGHAARVVRGL